MAIVNLLDLEKKGVSKKLKDYSMLIVGESGIGKSELALDIYGKDRTLALAFEDSYKGIAGAYAVNVNSYSELMAYVSQLENPAMKEKFDTIIIDTLYLLDHCIEKSIVDSYGVELLSDALEYNKAYKIVDTKFLNVLKRLQRAGYTLCYIAHPKTEKKKINGKEIVSYKAKVSNRVEDLLLSELDIRLFCFIDENGQRKIATKKNVYYDARCRVAEMPAILDFDAEVLRKAFESAIFEKADKGEKIIEQIEESNEKERTYEEDMAYLKDVLYPKIEGADKLSESSRIITSILGRDNNGKPRTLKDITPAMKGAVDTLIVELEIMLGMR